MVQAEIDAAAELIDFFRFNAKFAVELEGVQPISVSPSTNRMVYRGLEVPLAPGRAGQGPPGAPSLASVPPSSPPQGFVAAISPFNFTAIGGNLAGTPALMVRPGGGVVSAGTPGAGEAAGATWRGLGTRLVHSPTLPHAEWPLANPAYSCSLGCFLFCFSLSAEHCSLWLECGAGIELHAFTHESPINY